MGTPAVLRGTYHGTHVPGIHQLCPSKHDNTKQHTSTSTHPRTQEHMELQPHHHFATHTDPTCSPAQRYKPHSLSHWDRKNDGCQKGPKVRKHGVTVFGQACVRTRGGGGSPRALNAGSSEAPPAGVPSAFTADGSTNAIPIPSVLHTRPVPMASHICPQSPPCASSYHNGRAVTFDWEPPPTHTLRAGKPVGTKRTHTYTNQCGKQALVSCSEYKYIQ